VRAASHSRAGENLTVSVPPERVLVYPQEQAT
jgi:hypothetical protein